MRYRIQRDWPSISSVFGNMFRDLGDVKIENNILEFRSKPPTVSTGISLDCHGHLLANMPLHSIQSAFTTVEFDEALTFLRLEGPGVAYTYTIPTEILALRDAQA